METFGWYRLTGFLHQNILPAKDAGNHCRQAVVFFIVDFGISWI